MTAHRILLVLACLALWACAGSSTSSSLSPVATPGASTTAIVLRETPADLGCDAIGVDYQSVTFHIDPSATEQVSATTDTGVSLVTYWPVGFMGDATGRLVHDTQGNVVATDGDVLPNGQVLNGYKVCPTPTELYVMFQRPGAKPEARRPMARMRRRPYGRRLEWPHRSRPWPRSVPPDDWGRSTFAAARASRLVRSASSPHSGPGEPHDGPDSLDAPAGARRPCAGRPTVSTGEEGIADATDHYRGSPRPWPAASSSPRRP